MRAPSSPAGSGDSVILVGTTGSATPPPP
jgi:hypothetical protein